MDLKLVSSSERSLYYTTGIVMFYYSRKKKNTHLNFKSLVLVTDAGSDKLFNKRQEVDSEDYSGLCVTMIYS